LALVGCGAPYHSLKESLVTGYCKLVAVSSDKPVNALDEIQAAFATRHTTIRPSKYDGCFAAQREHCGRSERQNAIPDVGFVIVTSDRTSPRNHYALDALDRKPERGSASTQQTRQM
jgi:hypothetical protein